MKHMSNSLSHAEEEALIRLELREEVPTSKLSHSLLRRVDFSRIMESIFSNVIFKLNFGLSLSFGILRLLHLGEKHKLKFYPTVVA